MDNALLPERHRPAELGAARPRPRHWSRHRIPGQLLPTAAASVRSTLAWHHRFRAGRAVTGSGVDPGDAVRRPPRGRDRHRPFHPVRRLGGLFRRRHRRGLVADLQRLSRHPRPSIAHRARRLRTDRRLEHLSRRGHHCGDRVGVQLARAARPDPVLAKPRFRRGIEGFGRKPPPDHPRGDTPEPHPDRRRVLPVHDALRHLRLRRDRLSRARRVAHVVSAGTVELGRDAARGIRQQRDSRRLVVVVGAARPLRCRPRHRPRPAELRNRRVHQPTSARRGPDPPGGKEGRHHRPREAGHDTRGARHANG